MCVRGRVLGVYGCLVSVCVCVRVYEAVRRRKEGKERVECERTEDVGERRAGYVWGH